MDVMHRVDEIDPPLNEEIILGVSFDFDDGEKGFVKVIGELDYDEEEDDYVITSYFDFDDRVNQTSIDITHWYPCPSVTINSESDYEEE